MQGHADVSIMLDTYSHVIPGLGEATAYAINNQLGTRGVLITTAKVGGSPTGYNAHSVC